MAEGDGLLNRYVFLRIVGSNPTPSAYCERKASIFYQIICYHKLQSYTQIL